MIVPSIDLMNGRAVQLIGGREHALDGGTPAEAAAQFAVAGDLAVIDLDAALGTGNNAGAVRSLLRTAPCRVGGGIRDVATAQRWLDLGASKIILGTAAKPEILRELPRERVIAALDAQHGEVVVEGWRTATGTTIEERIDALREFVGGFLVTFVEREGRLTGLDLDRVRALREQAGDTPLTIAGGIQTAEEVGTLDRMGCDAQVGMALYTRAFTVADTIIATLRIEPEDENDPCYPTVVADEAGVALGLVWSSPASLRAAMDSRRGIYQSRKRGLWEKGLTSGATQELIRVDLDCDRDAIRFTVAQREPGFCHAPARTCWGEDRGLGRLERRLTARRASAPPASFTRRLFEDESLLSAKLREEIEELIEARRPEEIAWEAADVLYFVAARMVGAGVPVRDVMNELERRAGCVTREKRTPGEVYA